MVFFFPEILEPWHVFNLNVRLNEQNCYIIHIKRVYAPSTTLIQALDAKNNLTYMFIPCIIIIKHGIQWYKKKKLNNVRCLWMLVDRVLGLHIKTTLKFNNTDI